MIRLSHSALDVLLTCERKFQLDRLLVGSQEKKDYPTTVLGKAYGAGVQSYMTYQDVDRAVYDTYMNYFPVLEDNQRTEEVAINLILASIPTLDNLLMDWEVATFNSKPAIELSFRLNIDSTFYFVGYIDLVLRNKWTKRSAIMEVKTTALKLHSLDALYQNSGQALGYSIVLDKIEGESQSEYDVLYLAAQLGSGNGFSPSIKTLPYPKTLQDRLNWFITLGIDVNRLHFMLDNNIFPMRGGKCLQFMRPCPHLGVCNLHGLDEYKEQEEDLIEYDFTYELDEVIQNHLERMEK
jgi:hypothetical protein